MRFVSKQQHDGRAVFCGDQFFKAPDLVSESADDIQKGLRIRLQRQNSIERMGPTRVVLFQWTAVQNVVAFDAIDPMQLKWHGRDMHLGRDNGVLTMSLQLLNPT